MAGKDDYCPNCDNYISVIDDYRDKNKRLVAEINEICQNHDEL